MNLLYQSLTPKQQETLQTFTQSLQITTKTHVQNYASETQQEIANFSQKLLSLTADQSQDHFIKTLQTFLKNMNTSEKYPLPFLKKNQTPNNDSLQNLSSTLNSYKLSLLKSNAVLTLLQESNADHQTKLTLYLLAGEYYLPKLTQTDLHAPFQSKLADLSTSLTISIQTSAQCTLLQNTNTNLLEKLDTALYHTLPLAQNQTSFQNLTNPQQTQLKNTLSNLLNKS